MNKLTSQIFSSNSDLDYVGTKQECEKYINNIIFK